MSLELELHNNTAALQTLIKLLEQQTALLARPSMQAPEHNDCDAAVPSVIAPQDNADRLKTVLLNVAKQQGRDALVALLAQFGATKLTEVNASDYAAAIAAAEQSLQGAAA